MPKLLFGLIGNPVRHSMSAKYFNKKFKRENFNARYEAFELSSIDELADLLRTYPDLVALNVTSPFKKEVLKYVDTFTPEARETGAVNTLYIERNFNKSKKSLPVEFKIYGHNSDIKGFENLIASLSLAPGLQAVILGNGGATRAVYRAFRNYGISCCVVSRHPMSVENKSHVSESAGEEYRDIMEYETLGYSSLTPDFLLRHEIVVNATPLGMAPLADEAPPMDYSACSAVNIAIDLVYNPPVTRFMQLCALSGASVKNGLSMLTGQAEESWQFWCKHLKSDHLM